MHIEFVSYLKKKNFGSVGDVYRVASDKQQQEEGRQEEGKRGTPHERSWKRQTHEPTDAMLVAKKKKKKFGN